MMICVSANEAMSVALVLLVVIVQLNELPKATLPLVSSVLVTVRSEGTLTVLLSVFEVTPPAVAEAVFVTEPVVTSPAVTV